MHFIILNIYDNHNEHIRQFSPLPISNNQMTAELLWQSLKIRPEFQSKSYFLISWSTTMNTFDNLSPLFYLVLIRCPRNSLKNSISIQIRKSCFILSWTTKLNTFDNFPSNDQMTAEFLWNSWKKSIGIPIRKSYFFIILNNHGNHNEHILQFFPLLISS